MAITGDIFKSLTFGGVNSADYDVYITGAGTYSAPERAVEFVTVPGRNGDVVLDLGRWDNVTVTYPAGIKADTQTEFAEKMSAFRNAITSLIGYQRLTDNYNPNEYRLGAFVSGLDVSAVQNGRAGEFEIVFNCKPQRFLISGEDAITVTSGDVITNPTQYGAGPLLAIEGNGTVEFNGYTIEIDPGYYGAVDVLKSYETHSGRKECRLKTSLYNDGDNLTVSARWSSWNIYAGATALRSISNEANAGTGTSVINHVYSNRATCTTTMSTTFPSSADATATNIFTFDATFSDNTTVATTIRTSITYHYSTKQIIIGVQREFSGSEYWDHITSSVTAFSIKADSTKSYLGHPTYIDCEIGEAYRIDSGTRISLNAYISLGSDLPKLAPGANTVTFDNTITALELVPRWWLL